MSTPSDPLDPLFERWRAETPTLKRSLRSDVWSRIEQAEAHPGLAGWLDRIELAFSRPAFATAFVVACVLLGLFLAEARLSEHLRRESAEIERSYVHMLDPHADGPGPLAPTSFQP